MDAKDSLDALTAEPAGGVGRRQFLVKSATALLGGSTVAALMEGCGSDAVLAVFAAAVLAARNRFGGLRNALLRNTSPNEATVRSWINQTNDGIGALYPAARNENEDELRRHFDPRLQDVIDYLNQHNHPPNFRGNVPAFDAINYINARQRADQMLTTWDAAQRRAIWAFLVMFALLNPLAANAVLLQFAQAALALDTEDVGGRVHDAIFGGVAAGLIFRPSLLLSLFIPFIVLLLLGWGPKAAENLGLFVPAILAVMLLLLVYSTVLTPT